MSSTIFDDIRYFCPVCGYRLYEEPWKNGLPSDEICSSCGIHFGYDDAIGNPIEPKRDFNVYDQWREKWILEGKRWWSTGKSKPEGWNPDEQLKNLEKLRNNNEN